MLHQSANGSNTEEKPVRKKKKAISQVKEAKVSQIWFLWMVDAVGESQPENSHI